MRFRSSVAEAHDSDSGSRADISLALVVPPPNVCDTILWAQNDVNSGMECLMPSMDESVLKSVTIHDR